MTQNLNPLDAAALKGFLSLRSATVENVSARFESEFPEVYERFGERGREACREDISYTIDFLRPVLEFGLLQPFVEYIRWFRDVLEARSIPGEHVSLLLQWMQDFYRESLPSDTAHAITSVLQEARGALSVSGDTIDGIDRRMPAAWEEYMELEAALLDGNHRQCLQILQRYLQQGTSLLDAEIHLLQPALYQVGRDWQAGRVSVAREHLATSTASMIMAQLALDIELPKSVGAKVLLACVEGNQHAVGLRIVADGFEQSGWDVRFLGADVPVPSLIDEIMHWSPDLVGLSVSMPYQLRTVRETLDHLHAALGEQGPALILGGLAINGLPQIADLFGIPSAADARNAVDAAHGLIEQRA